MQKLIQHVQQHDNAADIITRKINGDDSIIQGITQDNTNSIQKVPQSTCVVMVSPNLTARVCNPNPNIANTTRCLCIRGDIGSGKKNLRPSAIIH